MCTLYRMAACLTAAISLIGFLCGIYKVGQIVLAETKAVVANQTVLRPLTEKEILQLYLYEQVGYNYKDYQILKRVIQCESHWDIMAYNPKTNDFGLFQINERWWDKEAQKLNLINYRDDWKENIQLGVWIYKNYGIKNWNWSKSCWK